MKKPCFASLQFSKELAERYPRAAKWLGVLRHWDFLVALARELAESAHYQIACLLLPGGAARTTERRRPFFPQMEVLELRTLPSTFQFMKSNYMGIVGSDVSDTADIAVTVKRAGSTIGPASVLYASSDDTASAGVDYGAVSGELDYANGQSLATFSVTVYEDDAASAKMTFFMLNLSNPTAGVLSSGLATASVTIVNETLSSAGGSHHHAEDDPGSGLNFALTSTSYTGDGTEVTVGMLVEGTGPGGVYWSATDDDYDPGPGGEIDFLDGSYDEEYDFTFDFSTTGYVNLASLGTGNSTFTEYYGSNVDGDWNTATLEVDDGGGGGGGPVLSHLVVAAPSAATAGSNSTFTVAAEDQYYELYTSYSGTVQFASSDGAATLPGNSTLIGGESSFSTTLFTAGSQTLTATDTVTSTLTGYSSPITVSPAVMSHYAVTAPSNTTAGSTIAFTVKAEDAYNNIEASYAGSVQFASSDVGASTVLPGHSTLSSGVGTFSATLTTSGTQTLTATDTVTTGITGHSVSILDMPKAATHYLVTAPSSATAGTGFVFTVTAEDQFNNTATGYTGTVHFSSSDPSATLPANHTLSSGVGTFTADLITEGTQTITATDASVASITGHSGGIVVNPNSVSHFVVMSVSGVTAGVQFTVSVTPEDAYNNAAMAYTGMIHLSSSDGDTNFYMQNALVTQNSGHFRVTLYTAGTQTVTATTTQNTSASGSTSISVSPASTYHFAVGVPTSTTAGSALVATVTAEDQFNNVTPSYTGTVSISASDSQAGLPANGTLSSGTGYFAVILKTAGNQTIAATDVVASSISGRSAAMLVNAAVANHFGVLTPGTAITGIAVDFTVQARDAFNNVAPTYTGTVHLSSSDTAATMPGNTTLSSGVGLFSATFAKTVTGTAHNPGSQKITATDATYGSISGVSAAIAVHALTVVGLTATATGFVINFNKPIVPATLDLYNSTLSGSLAPGPADISLVLGGTTIAGSVLLTDPNNPGGTPNTAITFVKTGGVLATGTYTVTLDSGSSGIEDTLGGLLDGNDDGSPGDNYVATFSVTAPSVVLGIPDFARGPNSVSNILVPNNGGTGIPITLSGASNVTDITFQLSYNPALLTISSTLNGTGGAFVLTSNSAGLASFLFESATGLSGNLTLGQIVARVPNSASANYGVAELLHLSNIVVNNGGVTATGADGVHVVAYLGDADGNGSYSTFDATDISRVAAALDTGFAFYPVFDPVIVGDVDNDHVVTTTDGGIINAYVGGSPELDVPAWPGGMHFEVTAPSTATAGTAVAFTVTLVDAFNNNVTNYIGTVHFTSTDTQAGLPLNATLSAGVGHFSVTLKTAGSQIVSATDSVMSGISGPTTPITVSPLTATHFSFKEPSSITAGSGFSFTVLAQDQYNNTAPTYAGTVHFSGGGSGATLPANSTLVSGVGTFSATLTTASTATISVSDTVVTSMTGSTGSIAMNSAAVTHFLLSGVPSTVGVGSAFIVTVTAEDQFNNLAKGYQGIIQFSSNDTGASLPGDVALVGGTGTFEAVLKTVGSRTLSVTDTAAGSITGSAGVTVSTTTASNAGVALSLLPSNPLVPGQPPTQGGLETVSVKVNALPDGLGEAGAGLVLYYDPAVFAVSDSDVNLGTVTTPSSGDPTGLGYGDGFSPAFPNNWIVSATTAIRGMIDITLINEDGSGDILGPNTTGGTLVTVNFHVKGNAPSGASVIDLAADAIPGAGPAAADFVTYLDVPTLNPMPIDNVSVLSPYVYGGSDPSDATVTVSAASHFNIAAGSSTLAGLASTITVTALNGDNSVNAGYSGTVHFSSSDGQAVLPANTTLTNGVGIFSVTLKTPGAQTVKANDTASTSTAGISETIAVTSGFAFTMPASITAGQPITITVIAQNLNTTLDSGYNGTIHFTSSDSLATLPANATLTNGVGVFSATLNGAGSETLTTTDTVIGLTGTSDSISVLPHFAVSAPSSVNAGTGLLFTVVAENGNNSTNSSYTGVVEFGSSADSATLPADATITGGTGTFSATLNTAGSQSLSVVDVSDAATGTSNAITVQPGTATYFDVEVPSANGGIDVAPLVQIDSPFGFVVIARDDFGNIATSYSGTVNLSSTDSLASFSSSASTLTNGVGLFTVTLSQLGYYAGIDALDGSIFGQNTVDPVDDATVTLSVPTTGLSAEQGGVVTAPINVNELANGLSSGWFDVYFNPAVFSVSALDVSLGTMATAGSTSIGHGYSPTSPHGWAAEGEVSAPGLLEIFLDGGDAITGAASGSLVNINFHVIGNAPAGSSMIDLAADDSPLGEMNMGAPYIFSTSISDQDFSDYALTSAPEDNTLLNPFGYHSSSDPTDGSVSVTTGSHMSVSATAITARVFSVTVTAQNSSGGTINYTGSAQFTSTDTLATLPTSAALTSGVGVFSVTLATPGSQLVTVSGDSMTGISNAIHITSSFVVTAPNTVTQNAPFVFTVTALDANLHTYAYYSDSAQFTSTDSLAMFSVDGPFTSGVGKFTATLATPGTQFLSANDYYGDYFDSYTGTYDSFAGTSNAITVLPTVPNYVRSTDSMQGQTVAVGNAMVSPSTGNVQVSQALNLNISPDEAVLGGEPALVYNSATSGNVYPIVEASYTSNPSLGVPTQLQARLDWGNTGTFPNSGAWTSFTIGSGHSAGDTYDLALQVPSGSAVPSTGYYPYVIQVQATYSGTTYTYSSLGHAGVVVQGSGDPYGQGWSIAGVDHLVAVSGGVLWVDGATASARFFAASPTGTFVSPANDFGTLAQSNVDLFSFEGDGGYVYTAKDQTQWIFTDTGLLSAIVSPDGSKRTFNYDSGGLLTDITDADGSTAVLHYNGSDKLTEIDAPGGRSYTVNVNSTSGNLASIIFPDGGVRNFTYDGNNKLISDTMSPLGPVTYSYSTGTREVSSIALDAASVYTISPANIQAMGTAASPANVSGTITDRMGHASIYSLDVLGRTTELQTPDGGTGLLTETWSLNGAGQPTTFTDALGRITSYAYAANGDMTQVTYPDLSEEKYTYDPTFDQPLTYTDQRNLVTTYVLDGYGEVAETIDPLGDVTTNTYYHTAANDGLLSSVEDGDLHFDYETYDGARRLATTADQTGDATTYQYDLAGNNNVVIDPLGHAVTTAYDAMGRPVSVTQPGGLTAYTLYDFAGNVTESIDEDGNITENTYDAQGRPSTTTTAVGTTSAATTETFYDVVGNVTETVDGDGNATTFRYDTANRLIATTDAAGDVTSSLYDKAGNVTESFDADGHPTKFLYDSMDRVTMTTDGDNFSTSVVYDKAGNVTESFDANGKLTSYTYDALGRATFTTDGAGGVSSVVYDKAGNITESFDADGHLTQYEYDVDNRLTVTIDGNNFSTSVVYDKAGNVTESYDADHHLSLSFFNVDNRLTLTTDGAGNSSSMVYDAAGNVTESFDGNGRLTQYVYDADNRVTETIDAAGGITKTLFDKSGNVTETIDADNHATRYFYDVLNRLTMTIDGDNFTSFSLYDKAGNVTESIDADGKVTEYAYDGDNRLTLTIDAMGHGTSMVYDKVGNVTESFDADGKLTQYEYDGDNRLVETLDAMPGTSQGITQTLYDFAGNVTETIDADTHTTTFLYDGDNRVTSTTDGAHQTTSMVHDKAGNVTESFDAGGHLTTYLYDGDNRVTAISDGVATSATTVYTSASMIYDGAGNVIESFDGDGHETQYTYDGDNRVTLTIDGAGKSSSMVYDAAGNVTESFDANGILTQFVFDGDERQVATVDNASHRTSTLYDPAGNVTGVVDPNNNLTQYLYDLDNRQTVTIDALGNRTTLVLDNVGNTLVNIDSDGNRTSFSYDADNRLSVTTDALGSTTTMYDKLGLVTGTVYPSTTGISSKSTSYSYDGDDRLSVETWYQGGSVANLLTYLYDAAGNMTVAANTIAGAYTAYTMSYDADNRVTSVLEPFGLTLAFTYDKAGNRTQVQDNYGGVLTSVFDGDNRLTSRQFGGFAQDQVREDLTYQNNGLLSTLTRYDAVAGLTTEMIGSTTYLYDSIERMTAISDYDSTGTLLASYAYSYDAGSRLTSETDNGSLETYGYDATNQLTFAGGNSFHYDANGNRVTGGYAAPGPDNEMLNDGTWTYTYDNQGNQVGKSDGAGDLWTYTYDNANHMTSAVESTGGSVVLRATYTYDAFGNRLETDVTQGGAETVAKYGYDGWNPAKGQAVGNENWDSWVSLNSNGSQATRLMRGDGVNQLFAQWLSTGSATEWLLTDHLGSVVGITSSTGTLQLLQNYDAFGNLTNSTSLSGNPTASVYSWEGMAQDQGTALFFFNRRYYNMVIGRFTSQDPPGIRPGNQNPYVFVHNSPTGFTDPSGMDSVSVEQSGPNRQEVAFWNFGGGTPPLLIGFVEPQQGTGNRILRTTQVIGGGSSIRVSLGFVRDYLAPQSNYSGLPPDLRIPTLQNLFQELQGRVNDRNPDLRLYGANGNQTAEQAFNEIQGQVGQLASHLATELAGAAIVSPGASKAAGRAFALFLSATSRTTGTVIRVINGKVMKRIFNGTYIEVVGDELKGLFQTFRQGGNQGRALLRNALGANPFPVAAQAHHIFPVAEFNTKLGQKLKRWGIGLNSAANGVLLPVSRFEGWEGAIHPGGRHLESYRQEVIRLLNLATTREEALEALSNIRKRLLNGTLQINNL